MLFDTSKTNCDGNCICDENSNWLVPKSSVEKIEYPNPNQAYITPDNTLYVLSHDGKMAVPVNGFKEQPTQIENEDGYLEVKNSGTYDVTINASPKLLTDINDKVSPNLLRFSEGTEFQSNYWSRLTSEEIDGQESFKISRSNWTPGSQRIFATLDERFLPTNLQPRELYTISMSYYIVPDGNFTTTALTDFIIRLTDGVTRRDISTGSIQDSPQGEWHRISGSAEFPEGFQISVVSFNLGGNGTVYFRELKVETGSSPSTWVPNYKDLGTYEHEVNKEIHVSEQDRESWDSKQAKLTAGNNISISEENAISAILPISLNYLSNRVTNQDWNTLRSSGIYYVANATGQNKPEVVGSYFGNLEVLNSSYSAGTVLQRYTNFSNQIFVRRYSGNPLVWSDWKEVGNEPLPIATETTIGGVTIGEGLAVSEEGHLRALPQLSNYMVGFVTYNSSDSNKIPKNIIIGISSYIVSRDSVTDTDIKNVLGQFSYFDEASQGITTFALTSTYSTTKEASGITYFVFKCGTTTKSATILTGIRLSYKDSNNFMHLPITLMGTKNEWI